VIKTLKLHTPKRLLPVFEVTSTSLAHKGWGYRSYAPRAPGEDYAERLTIVTEKPILHSYIYTKLPVLFTFRDLITDMDEAVVLYRRPFFDLERVDTIPLIVATLCQTLDFPDFGEPVSISELKSLISMISCADSEEAIRPDLLITWRSEHGFNPVHFLKTESEFDYSAYIHTSADLSKVQPSLDLPRLKVWEVEEIDFGVRPHLINQPMPQATSLFLGYHEMAYGFEFYEYKVVGHDSLGYIFIDTPRGVWVPVWAWGNPIHRDAIEIIDERGEKHELKLPVLLFYSFNPEVKPT